MMEGSSGGEAVHVALPLDAYELRDAGTTGTSKRQLHDDSSAVPDDPWPPAFPRNSLQRPNSPGHGLFQTPFPPPDSLFHLRYLYPADIDSIKRLCAEIFPIEYPDYWYSEIIYNQQLFSMAAVTSATNEIVGLIVAEIKTVDGCNPEDKDLLDKSFPSNSRVAYILSLGVTAYYRKNGVASKLLQHFLQYINTTGTVKAVYLHVLCENEQAIRFYEKRQFVCHARLKEYYRIGDRLRDGFTYVLYVNGGCPAWSLQSCTVAAVGLCLSPIRKIMRLLYFPTNLIRYLLS